MLAETLFAQTVGLDLDVGFDLGANAALTALAAKDHCGSPWLGLTANPSVGELGLIVNPTWREVAVDKEPQLT